MAFFGRRFPIKPHLARPIVSTSAPAAPIVTAAKIAGLKQAPRQLFRAHLARPIIPPEPAIVTRPYVVVAKPVTVKVLKAHLARPIPPPPLVSSAKVVTLKQSFAGRVFRVRSAAPLVNQPPLVTRPYIISVKVVAGRKVYVKVARPVLTTPALPPLWTKAFIIRARSDKRPAFRAKYAGGIVIPFIPGVVGPGGLAIAAQAQCSGALTCMAINPGAVAADAILPGAIKSMAVCSGAIQAQGCADGGALTSQSF